MRKIGVLAFNSFWENIGNRVFILVLVFGGILIYFSLILGALAVDQEIRVLMDVGLGLIEMIVLAATLYASATLFLREIQTKTIYLILARPLTRFEYLIGRFLGLLLSSLLAILMMAAIHIFLLLTKGWHWHASYLVDLCGIFLKIMIAMALAVFFALISTSAIAAILFSGSLWALGHFIPEMRFMAFQSGARSSLFLNVIIRLIPNFQMINWQDYLPNPALIGGGVLYAFSYSAACLLMSWAVLRKKEF